METKTHIWKQKEKNKKIFFFFKNKNKNKNNLLSKKLSTKKIKYNIFIYSNIYNSIIYDKNKNILIFNGKHPSKFIQEGNIYKYINVSNIKKISNGINFTLILSKDNKLYAFGDNVHGQCGIDNLKYPIVEIPTIINYFKKIIIDIVCLFETSYVLLENNELYIFGENINTYIPQKIIIFDKIDKILPSSLSYTLNILTDSGKIYKGNIDMEKKFSFSLFFIIDKNKFKGFFNFITSNFILLEDNIVYIKDTNYDEYEKYEIPSLIPIGPEEHIIKIIGNINIIVYLTTKSVYVFGSNKYNLFGNINEKNEIEFFRNKNIIDIIISPTTAMAISKNGIVYGWGLNEKNIGLLRNTKETIRYNSPIILYSS